MPSRTGSRWRENEGFVAAQFKPGQSGNPSGRPKGPSFRDRVNVWLRKSIETKPHMRDCENREDWIAAQFAYAVSNEFGEQQKLVLEYLKREYPEVKHQAVSGISEDGVVRFAWVSPDENSEPRGEEASE